MTAVSLTFEHWGIGAIAALAASATIAAAATLRPAVPRATLVLAAAGALLLAAAAGGFAAWRPAARPVAVMVDLSPSTRGAGFHDAANLERRIRELLGDTPHEVRYFGEGPAARTILPATDAPAVLLFSDGRLAAAPDALPPVFAVIDPALEHVDDAAVTSLVAAGDAVSVGVRNTAAAAAAAPRPLALRGINDIPTFPRTSERPTTSMADLISVAPGSFVLTKAIAPNAQSISATFAPGDVWPENDAMRAVPPPPAVAERWRVGDTGSAPPGWRMITPGDLPRDAAQFLGPAVVVLDNVSADALDDAQRATLQQYVRDLGGGLVILGGDRAFAAGGYAGTALDALSPLASTPPEPTTHWLLLADASGSMNQDADVAGHSRWHYASQAVAAVAKQLPPADLLSIGSFAGEVRWWYRAKPVTEALSLPLPPDDVSVRGKTNLEAALREIAADADGQVPSHALVATDAQTSIEDPVGLAAQFKSRKITLHVLLIGESDAATGVPALQSIVSATGGSLRAERLPENWAAGVRELLRAAKPAHVQRESVSVRFLDRLAAVTAAAASPWNRTWPKSGVTPLAQATTAAGERLTMAARWNVGEGRVAATAFTPSDDAIEAIARLVERPPRDPRFNLRWETGSTLRVTVDAAEGRTYLNGESLTLELRTADGKTTRHAIPQTGPGRYVLGIDSPRQSSFASVRRGEQVLDTVAVAERYAPEFDAVGNDRVALTELARRTGGGVVEPGVTRRLDIPWPRRPVSLVSFLASAGAALVAAGLVRWRIGS